LCHLGEFQRRCPGFGTPRCSQQCRHRSSSAAIDAEARDGATTWTSPSSARSQWRQAFTLARAAPEPQDDVPSDSNAAALQANICMVGAGNMGGAMLRGWIASGCVTPDRTSVCTRSQEKAIEWQDAGLGEVRSVKLSSPQYTTSRTFKGIIFATAAALFY
jgi:hypothetical protein